MSGRSRPDPEQHRRRLARRHTITGDVGPKQGGSMPTPPSERWRSREDRGAELSATDIEVRRLRYEEWMRERDLVATIILGGTLRTDGYGRPAGFRVLGYSKPIDKAIEIALRDGLGIRRPNEMFYADLTLTLWSPSGPKK